MMSILMVMETKTELLSGNEESCLGKGLAERKGKHWDWGDGSLLVKAFVVQA